MIKYLLLLEQIQQHQVHGRYSRPYQLVELTHQLIGQ